MKKFLAILMAAMMLLATAGIAFADNTPPYAIKIHNNKENVSIIGATYNAYMLFKATPNTTADGVTTFIYTQPESGAFEDLTYPVDGESLKGSALLNYLSKNQDDGAAIRAFADYVYETYVKDKGVTPDGTTGVLDAESGVIALDNAGYYLVFGTGSDKQEGENKATLTSLVALTPSNNGDGTTATVYPKLDVPTLDKKIYHNENEEWEVVGDNQIGDDVNYRIVSSIPNLTGFSSFTYKIHDNMDKALLLKPETIEIYADEAKTELLFSNAGDSVDETFAKVETYTDHSFTISVDIRAAQDKGKIGTTGSIYTFYSAVLTEDARIYTEGPNKNTAHLEYSNNPYDELDTEETPDVTVYDWTFTFDVEKVDGDKAPLADALFVLSESNLGVLSYVENEDGSHTITKGDGAEVAEDELIWFVQNNGTYTVADADKEGNTEVLGGKGMTEFKLEGLDDETTYYLHEVKAPNGYNKLKTPVNFTISANAQYSSTGDQIDKDNVSVTLHNGEAIEGMLATQIINNWGAELPSTGGIGTTLFYLFGSLMTAGSALILVVRRRAEAEEE